MGKHMTNRTSLPASRNGGYTLVELMVTCAVLAIIVGIAAPAYTSQMHKSRRADARNALLDLAGREERYLSTANSYTQNGALLGYTNLPIVVNNGFYQLSATVPDPNQPLVLTSFILTATAIGAQASDTDCASFTVNQLGQQAALNSAAANNTTTCWGL
jgi:type IV pilus assembly protein PilE